MRFLLILAVASVFSALGVASSRSPDLTSSLVPVSELADTSRINDLIGRSRMYVRSDVALADSLANVAFTMLEHVDYPKGLVRCLILMSNIEITTGDLETAFKYGTRARGISEEHNMPELLSESYNQLYLLYFQQGRYDSATIAAEKSMDIARSVNYKSMLGRGHQNFGVLNSIRGNHSKAIEHFLLSEQYYSELNDTVALALLVGNLGVTFEESGNTDKALEYMHKQLALSKLTANENLQGWAMTNIGSVHSIRGTQDSALYYYTKSLAIAEENQNHDLTITNLDNIGSYYSHINSYDTASSYLTAALRLAQSSGFGYQEVYVVGHLAENYFASGQLDSALYYANRQLNLASSVDLQVDRKMAFALLAKINEEKTNYPDAVDALKNYIAVNDSLFSEEKARQLEELRESYETEKKDQQISALVQQKQAADFRRNTFAVAGLIVIAFLLLVYSRQRMIGRKNRELLEKGQEVEHMKSRFFSNISHEFRTPLTLILGPIEALHETTADPHSKFQLDVMRKNAGRLLMLTNQLLDLSKLDSGKVKLQAARRDIVPVLKGISMSFETMAEMKRISLQTHIRQEHLEFYFDLEKVETVLINVLSNSFKFTPENGAISIRLNNDDSFCTITVTDSGRGISESEIPHVFDRFYQGSSDDAHAHWAATGIGLALVKELVELHHGDVEARNAPGNGTLIVIRLPLGTDHLSGEEIVKAMPIEKLSSRHVFDDEEEVVEQSSKNSKPLVLLIEDNSDVMAYLRNILRESYEIIEANDGGQGVQIALELIPDIIISDVMMPVRNGYEVCSILKKDEKTSHIPLILLTAKASPEDRIHGLSFEADDYLVKPFIPRELEVRMNNLIESRRRLREKYNRQLVLMPEETPVSSVDEVFLTRVMSVVHNNLSDEDFSVEQLGRDVGMSRSQIHRKLHALTSQSPSQLIRSIRLTRAKSLIEQNAGTISEIAYSVGFGSPSYFNKCFLQQFGCTPTEIRKSGS